MTRMPYPWSVVLEETSIPKGWLDLADSYNLMSTLYYHGSELCFHDSTELNLVIVRVGRRRVN